MRSDSAVLILVTEGIMHYNKHPMIGCIKGKSYDLRFACLDESEEIIRGGQPSSI